MTATKDPADRVLDQIAKGHCDGRLVEIAEAIGERLRKGGASPGLWRITLDGDSWTQETVTLGELTVVETLTGKGWLDLDPKASVKEFTAFVVAHLHKVGGLTIPDAVAKAEAMSQNALAEALSVYEKPVG